MSVWTMKKICLSPNEVGFRFAGMKIDAARVSFTWKL